MPDPIYEALEQIIYILGDPSEDELTPQEFESLLADMGLMIVPIEDPTNLRFGVED